MSNYDFSELDTEDLERAVRMYDGDMGCHFITCIRCPFKGLAICDDEDKIHELFKEELARRKEMENNKMPELKAGMIVETDRGKLFIVLTNFCGELGWYTSDGRGSFKFEDTVIIKIYSPDPYSNYYGFFTNTGIFKESFSIIWEKESQKDKKIKEIKNTIKELNKQIEDLENE